MINHIFHTFLKGTFVMYVVIKFCIERPPKKRVFVTLSCVYLYQNWIKQSGKQTGHYWTGTSGVWNGAKREAEANYERNGGWMSL